MVGLFGGSLNGDLLRMILTNKSDLVVGKLYKHISSGVRLCKTQQDLEDSYTELVHSVGSIRKNDIVVLIEVADIKHPTLRNISNIHSAIYALTTDGKLGWCAVRLHHWATVDHE